MVDVRAKIKSSFQVSKVRARAPLRLGFAGGGTDVSPYCDRYGGSVLNATISMFAHASIELRNDGKVRFLAVDRGMEFSSPAEFATDPKSDLALHQGVHNRVCREFLDGAALPVTLTTYCDAPPGSGLGSSSTLVVAMIEAYRELLALPLGEYDVARLAYEIERIDVDQAGGRQDQYAATFGGVNFMEFAGDRVVVNPLRIRPSTMLELEATAILYFTGRSRDSAAIIRRQSDAVTQSDETALEATHQLKRDAVVMKEALLGNDLNRFAEILNSSWESKKKLAGGISNDEIDNVFEVALAAGARAGKVSGAGGGGFVFFVVEPTRRLEVMRALSKQSGFVMTCSFTEHGVQAWRA